MKLKRIKQFFCRHDKHERHTKVENGCINYKVFCGGCDKFLKTFHWEDSPAQVKFWKAEKGFDESFTSSWDEMP